jgi:transposase
LYVAFYAQNITGEQIVAFLRQLLRNLRGPVVLLWDGSPIHRRRLVREFLRQHHRLQVHQFPGYAPELNPDEWVWQQAKHALSNSAPKNGRELDRQLRNKLRRIRRSQRLLWSCIFASKLPWQK